MKKLLIGMTAAATLLTAAPALAQIGFRAGDDGFSVRVGPSHPGWRDYGYDRGRHYGWCPRVTVRERLPNGTVIIRRERRC